MITKVTKHWHLTKDGDAYARALFHRHYSYKPYKDGRKPKLFCGPGYKTVLIMEGALFIWRKYLSKEKGVNCSVFRNETDIKSSDLILEAEQVALDRWGPIRMFTYVAPLKIRSTNPGYCFKQAGWKTCGITKWNKLIVLEKLTENKMSKQILKETVDKLQEAEDNLWTYLVDNTENVFEEISEVDSARNLIIEIKEKLNKQKAK